VNEKVALNTERVRAKFAEKKIILMRADWTNQNGEITKRLESYGRSGVPLYVFYSGKDKEFVLLPQLLTPDIVIGYLDRL
jgi:thiol:disulfide interchange protein DsbD